MSEDGLTFGVGEDAREGVVLAQVVVVVTDPDEDVDDRLDRPAQELIPTVEPEV